MRAWLWFGAVLLAAGGCGGGRGDDDDDFGGDADADADADTCSESADNCGGETICIGGACESAFGRRYRFSGISVSIPDRKRDGTTWDALGGAPDPYVEVWINDSTLVLRTPAVDDVFDADFSDTGDGTVGAGDSVFLNVWDEDVADPDPVLSCTADPLPADVLRGRGFACDSDGYYAQVTITPR